MRKIIHKIRLQPPEFRIMVAVLAAMIMTIVIGSFWVSTISSGTFQESRTTKTTEQADGAFTTLLDSIKSIFRDAPGPGDALGEMSNTVQIIDSGNESASTTDTLYDESNPAS